MPYRDPIAALEIKLRELRETRRELDASIAQTRQELARLHRPRRRRRVSMMAAAITLTVFVAACLAAVVPMTGPDCRAISYTAVKTVKGAAMLYVGRNSECPSVQALIADGLLDPDQKTTDEWDNPFRIECVRFRIIVHSAGPDGEHGTLDDISAPPPNRLLSEPRALYGESARDGSGLACFGR